MGGCTYVHYRYLYILGMSPKMFKISERPNINSINLGGHLGFLIYRINPKHNIITCTQIKSYMLIKSHLHNGFQIQTMTKKPSMKKKTGV